MKTILLSFQNEWFQLLEAGKSKYEYRMVLPEEETKVFFYVSKPIMAISGMAYFGPRESLQEWLSTYGKKSAEVKSRIEEFLTDCKYAVPIYSFQPTNRISLQQLRDDVPGFAPPRMYYYIDNTDLSAYLEANLHPIGEPFHFSFDKDNLNDICV